jgi:hypothetical protein
MPPTALLSHSDLQIKEGSLGQRAPGQEMFQGEGSPERLRAPRDFADSNN